MAWQEFLKEGGGKELKNKTSEKSVLFLAKFIIFEENSGE